jgi:hypothetical protein
MKYPEPTHILFLVDLYWASMSTIAAAVFDVVAALPGRACSMHDVVKALPDI